MPCKRCGGTVLPPATICGKCDAPPPADAAQSAPKPETRGGVEAMVPTKNKPALISYYCGLLSVIPYAGLVLAPVAIVAGIVGLTRPPEQRGRIHAVVGIVAGLVLGAVGHVLRDRLRPLLGG